MGIVRLVDELYVFLQHHWKFHYHFNRFFSVLLCFVSAGCNDSTSVIVCYCLLLRLLSAKDDRNVLSAVKVRPSSRRFVPR